MQSFLMVEILRMLRLYTFRVPLSFHPLSPKLSIPKSMMRSTCLGCVIRGSTSHYDLVSGESAKIGSLSTEYRIPVIFGVITTENIEQAIERAGSKAGNKGFEACVSAIEMINLFREL
jgi:6,7-dimethyl-8-ribityllumazine synthase